VIATVKTSHCHCDTVEYDTIDFHSGGSIFLVRDIQMVDTAFAIRNGIVVIGLLTSVALTVAALILQGVPWWVFFIGVLVLPTTDPVAKRITLWITGEDVDKQRSADTV
jgi:hypothetical protein